MVDRAGRQGQPGGEGGAPRQRAASSASTASASSSAATRSSRSTAKPWRHVGRSSATLVAAHKPGDGVRLRSFDAGSDPHGDVTLGHRPGADSEAYDEPRRSCLARVEARHESSSPTTTRSTAKESFGRSRRAGRSRSSPRPRTAATALEQIKEHQPDVALLDYKLPELDGVAITNAVVREKLPTRVLLVSAFTDSGIVYKALETGAAGFVSKEARREQIVDAVLACARGENVVPPDVAAGLVSEIRLRKKDDAPALTQREHEILQLIAAGQEPAGDREGALPRADDREDARPASVREARCLRPGRGRRERHAARPDRVAACAARASAASRGSRRGSGTGRRLATTPGDRAARARPGARASEPRGHGLRRHARRLLRVERRCARLGVPAAGQPSGSRSRATGVDIAAISVLALLSGGAFSHARLAFFLVPVAVAFRFRPSITAAAAVVTTIAYIVQARRSSRRADEPDAARFIPRRPASSPGSASPASLLSLLLARRTELVERLAAGAARSCSRTPWTRSSGSAGPRRRPPRPRAPEPPLGAPRARGGGETASNPALERADAALVGDGRAAARRRRRAPPVRARAGRPRGGDPLGRAAGRTHARTRAGSRPPNYRAAPAAERCVFSAARELLSNVVRHADATVSRVTLVEIGRPRLATVEDDGQRVPGRAA